MSALEFIAACKWPIVVLVALGAAYRSFRDPENRRWFRDFFGRRDISMKLGPAEAAATLSAVAGDAVQTAASTDAQLQIAAGESHEEPDPAESDHGNEAQHQGDEVAGLRREAVESVMRTSARWGWEMSQMGFRTPPDPQIHWREDGRPEILFGQGASQGRVPEGIVVVVKGLRDALKAVNRDLDQGRGDAP